MTEKNKENEFHSKEREERFQADRLYQILKQEGVISEDESGIDWSRVHRYVALRKLSDEPAEKEFFEKMMEIVKRDEKGEWSKEYIIGEPVAKLNDIEK